VNLPPFVKSLAFWNAVSWVVAGVLGLLVYFGVLSPEYNYTAAAILVAIQAVLKVIQVIPELKSK
jgi:hypothetical protein